MRDRADFRIRLVDKDGNPMGEGIRIVDDAPDEQDWRARDLGHARAIGPERRPWGRL